MWGGVVVEPCPHLQLRTLFCFDASGRLVSTKEPDGDHGPAFVIIRGHREVAWAVHADVPVEVAEELDALAATESRLSDPRAQPDHAAQYQALAGSVVDYFGPGFHFGRAALVDTDEDIVPIMDERLLQRHFPGWRVGEIDAGRGPVLAILDGLRPVSVAFAARWGEHAAEAGVETAAPYRGRGLAPRVVSAWARAVRDRGRIPLYSTSWENESSQAVARKLGLTLYAVEWALSG